jgi:hypothetical protein
MGEAMSDQDARLPDLLLERYRLGEMSGEQREVLERRLAADPEGQARLKQLQESDLEIERQHPPEWLAERVRERLQARAATAGAPFPGRSRWAFRWPIPAALASAAAVLIAVAHLSRQMPSPESSEPVSRPSVATAAPAAASGDQKATPVHDEGDRVKGLRPSLTLYRKTSEGSEALETGARVRAGDVVRLAYRSAGRGYGTILSIDGRGVVTRHLPKTGARAVPLKSGETVLLDRAYELDDAPRFERFYLIASETPFELEPVLAAARRAAASAGAAPAVLGLPGAFEQSTFSLEKEATR